MINTPSTSATTSRNTRIGEEPFLDSIRERRCASTTERFRSNVDFYAIKTEQSNVDLLVLPPRLPA